MHGELGKGFPESVYQAAPEKEFNYRNIPYERELRLPVQYKGEVIGEYRADFVCFKEVIVELKALKVVMGNERAQVINYLKASNLHRALLINFGTRSLQYERIVFNFDQRESVQSADGGGL